MKSKHLGTTYCLLCVLLLSPFTTTAMAAGPAPVNLGSTSGFSVLAGAAVTLSPPGAITGDVGISPAAESNITGFSQTDWTGYATSIYVTGKIYAADMAVPTPAMLTTAKGDLTIAYNAAAGRTPVPVGPFLNPGSGNLAGLDLVPGLYKFTGEAIATTDFTLTGSASDVWIFQIGTALTVSNGVHVTLAGDARAENIFWQVGSSAILGTTSVFHGTIMADQSITMQTGATLNGRALAFSGTVALASNTITAPPVTYLTISGTVTGATSSTAVAAIDVDSVVVDRVDVTSDGAYSVSVPSGFCGWVVPDSASLVFHPFRRAYSHVTASKTDQNFKAFPCVLTRAQLDADYKITYRKDGKGANVSADVTITSDGGLVLVNPGAKDTLTLARSLAVKKAKGIPRAIRSISTTGGLGNLTVEGDVMRLSVGGELAKLTATHAIACDVATSGALGMVRMTSRPDVENVDMITNIVAAGSASKKASVTLNGAKLETLAAKTQDFTAITLSTKQDPKTKKVQMSGLLGGVGGAPDVQVKSALSLTANGAYLSSFAIVGGIKKLQATSIKLSGVPYMGVIDVFWFDSSADGVTIQATGGKIAGAGYYVASGKIAKFAATARKGYEGSGVIGESPTSGSSPLTTSTSSGVEVMKVANAIFAVSGADPAVGNSDIAGVTAQTAMYAVFYAGATMSGITVNGLPVTTKLTPNNAGRLVTIRASKTIATDSIARVYATTDAKKKTKVLPKGSPVTLIYNDGL